MKIAFYKARTARDRSLMDLIVAFIDRSDTSHCELVVAERQTSNGLTVWSTEGCHMARGGVHKTDILVNVEDWRVYELPESIAEGLEPYEVLKGQKYDWLGALATRWVRLPHSKKRKVCSTYLAKRLGLANYSQYGVADLEYYILYMVHTLSR